MPLSEYILKYKLTYILATEAHHKLGDISREIEAVAYFGESDDDNYYGSWAEGFGFFNVKFPKKTSTIISEDMANAYLNPELN